MIIKKLVGSVMAVFRSQGDCEAEAIEYETNAGHRVNKATILVDLPRTPLVDFSGKTHDTFKNECSRDAIYDQHYKQGLFDGGGVCDVHTVYTLTKIKELEDRNEGTPEEREAIASELLRESGSRKTLRFAYRDDDGKLCALGLSFSPNKPNSWSLQIFKNTTEPLESRETTLFSQGELPNAQNYEEVQHKSLPAEIELALNSKMVNKLISGLITKNGDVSLKKFDELDHRMVTNHNIDNRDAKQVQLDELIVIASTYSPSKKLDAYLKKIQEHALTDPNFFKDDHFLKTLKDIVEHTKHKDDQIATNIVQLTCDAIVLEVHHAADKREGGARDGLMLKAHGLREERQRLESLMIDYEKNITLFNNKLISLAQRSGDSENLQKFHQQGVNVLTSIQEVAGKNSIQVSEHELTELNQVLTCCTTTIDDIDKPINNENIVQLEKLAQSASGKPSTFWKSLGVALLAFAGAALVVAGALGVIPTGGTSLLLAVAGVMAVTAAGVYAFHKGSEHGLAKSISDFRSSISEMKEEDDDQKNPQQGPK